MDEDAMYEFVGLRAEDERAEEERAASEARFAAETMKEGNVDIEGAELPVDDLIPGEESNIYDRGCMNLDASNAIAHGVKAVYPWVEHRECFVHLMKNFSKKNPGSC
jgi:hypothetical protein